MGQNSKKSPVVYKQILFAVMTGKNYLHFSARDFASDSYFQKWILEDDLTANLFWEKWLADNPEKKPKLNWPNL